MIAVIVVAFGDETVELVEMMNRRYRGKFPLPRNQIYHVRFAVDWLLDRSIVERTDLFLLKSQVCLGNVYYCYLRSASSRLPGVKPMTIRVSDAEMSLRR